MTMVYNSVRASISHLLLASSILAYDELMRSISNKGWANIRVMVKKKNRN